MDVIAVARQLGQAIQQDERYLKFAAAKDVTESDTEVLELMDKINEIREAYQAEAVKDDADQNLLTKLDGDFQKIYTSLMVNEKMSKYEESRHELDAMMNYVMQILYLCVNGEDPATCEPQEEEHSCGGSCSSCGGC